MTNLKINVEPIEMEYRTNKYPLIAKKNKF